MATFDQARARWPTLPIFVWGSSAGAHWGLLLGSLRPLAGVIGEGTPADFEAWRKATIVGRYFLFALGGLFGEPNDPSPNVDDYDPARYYPTETDTPVLLISGADVKGIETDKVIGERTARAFARVNAGLTQIRLLRPGSVYWSHARVNGNDLDLARDAALAFLERNRGKTPGAPPPLTGVITTCNDAPAGAGLAGTGAFAETRGSDGGNIVMDVSENACAQTESRGTITPQGVHTSVTDGLQLRVSPGPDGTTVPRGLAATATLDGGGADITSYSAVYRGWRTDPSYELRLTANTADGRKIVLAGCDADADCNGIFAPGTLPGVDAQPARQLFALPEHTTSLRWSLTCRADGCPAAATHDADLRGQPATLSVYGSTATIGVPAPEATPAPVPTPVTTPDTDPGAPVNPEFGSIFRFGNRSDIELACGDSLSVDGTHRDGRDMVVHGFAAENLIGHRIAILRGKDRVGTATVSTKRDWTARVRVPRGRPVRYVARSGPVHIGFLGPAALTITTHRKGHNLVLRGQAPAGAHGLVVVQRLIGCGDWNAVAETKATHGRFRVAMRRPAARAVLLRATLRWHGRTLRSY